MIPFTHSGRMQKLLYFIVHFLFWTTFVALSWMSISSNPEEIGFFLMHPESSIFLILWGISNFYIFYFYFQPLFLDTRRYYIYLTVSIVYSVVMSLFFVGIFWLLYPSFREVAYEKLIHGIVGAFLTSQCGSLLRGFISWNQNLQNKTALENQSLRNELAMLKAQLSPHFLFNTLNNIDSLIYKSQDEASAMLIKLASLLRYMLYESEGKEVPLEQEMEYIRQLAELQRMRFEQPDYVRIQLTNEATDLTIAPLLFLPFIENAFKFVSQPAEMPAISIDLNANKDRVQLICRNYFGTKPQESDEKRQGIGLANARRRLELLYPDAFDLLISRKEKVFEVNLSIAMT